MNHDMSEVNVLGIVGSEAAKFTSATESTAKLTIETLILRYSPSKIISGGCHLGGIDIWAKESAKEHGVPFVEHLPKTLSWNGGYKERNQQIATESDLVVCITVQNLPKGFLEKGWERYCYHCKTDAHIKSGGCWTVKYAKSIGKRGETIVV